jgi:hypothetical protein
MSWSHDVYWFTRSFFASYTKDHIRPYLTEPIREACAMIMSDDKHNKGIIGTTFMFGIMEFYAKHHLGFRPMQYNFSDPCKHDYTRRLFSDGRRRKLTLAPAFEFLQKENFPIAHSLNEIDRFTIENYRSLVSKSLMTSAYITKLLPVFRKCATRYCMANNIAFLKTGLTS